MQAAATEDASLGAILRARWEAFKGGDVGSLPVIFGIVAITIFFTSKSNIFFTAVNFSNLIGQMAGTTVIAIGIVLLNFLAAAAIMTRAARGGPALGNREKTLLLC